MIESENVKTYHKAETSYEDQSVIPGIYYPPKRYRKRSHGSRLKRTRNQRAVLKTGQFNVDKPNPDHKFKFLSNWFVSLVEARWRWTLLNFFMAFTGDWLFFGFIYWIIAVNHGDLMEGNLPQNQNDTDWIPCVENIYGFTSSFLFSIEVHTTVAYGRRSITLECPQAILAMCMQCILSSIFQAFMVGILFAKLTRPKARTQTILFSKNAVVSLRDGKLCLIFRVGDIRKSRILNIKSSVFLMRFEANEEDDFEQVELDVVIDGCESMFFLWPVSVIHVIDEKSPLYTISAADLMLGQFELLVVFEGIIESTGQPVQARSSFTENEILWGHRLIPMVQYNEIKGGYEVDFSKISDTVQVDIPLCSSSQLDSVINLVRLDSLSRRSSFLESIDGST